MFENKDTVIALCICVSEQRQYYSNQLAYVTSQTQCHADTAPSILELSAAEIAEQQEWENEWNHSGLASRLSQKVMEQQMHMY